MNIQQLQYIIELDKHRHFLRASEACFITQATLSAMIKKLETELNVVLFDRSKHPVEPTNIGRDVIDQAKIALQETNKIKEIIHENKAELKGTLKIGIIPSLAPYLLPLFLKQFMNDYNEITLVINELTTNKIKENLKQGIIDVAILAIPLIDNDLKEENLFYEEFYYYGSLNSVDGKRKHIFKEDIDINRLLLLEEGHCLRNQMINICEMRNKKNSVLKIDYQSGSIETLKQMVDLGMGSTIIPALSVLTLTESQKSKIYYFEAPFPVREIGLVYYRHFTKKKMIEALKKSILENIPKNILREGNMSVIPITDETREQ